MLPATIKSASLPLPTTTGDENAVERPVRTVFQRSFPVAASTAKTDEPLVTSRTTATSPSARIGDVPLPKSNDVVAGGCSYVQSCLPAKSYATSPQEPK